MSDFFNFPRWAVEKPAIIQRMATAAEIAALQEGRVQLGANLPEAEFAKATAPKRPGRPKGSKNKA